MLKKDIAILPPQNNIDAEQELEHFLCHQVEKHNRQIDMLDGSVFYRNPLNNNRNCLLHAFVSKFDFAYTDKQLNRPGVKQSDFLYVLLIRYTLFIKKHHIYAKSSWGNIYILDVHNEFPEFKLLERRDVDSVYNKERDIFEYPAHLRLDVDGYLNGLSKHERKIILNELNEMRE